MKIEAKTRPAEQTVSYQADTQIAARPAVIEQRPGRHRRPRERMLQKAAHFITGRFRKQRPAQSPDAVAAPTAERVSVAVPAPAAAPVARAAVASVAELSPPAEDVRQPIAPRLRYGQTEREVMRPHGTGENNDYRLQGNIVTPSTHQPLLSKEQVSEQLGEGFDIGSLQAVIHLPEAEEPLYVFNQTRTHRNGDVTPRFMFATPTQLGKMRTHIEIGQPSREEIDSEIAVIERGPGSTPQDMRLSIGASRWLPGRPADSGQPVPEQYAHVADRQLVARIDEDGVLMLRDLDATHPTVIETNPNLIIPQDPWPEGPNYNEAVVF